MTDTPKSFEEWWKSNESPSPEGIFSLRHAETYTDTHDCFKNWLEIAFNAGRASLIVEIWDLKRKLAASAGFKEEELNRLAELYAVITKGVWTWEDESQICSNVATLYAGRSRGMNGTHGLNLFGRLECDSNGRNNLNFICAVVNAFQGLLRSQESGQAGKAGGNGSR